jgi:hypothetical protein
MKRLIVSSDLSRSAGDTKDMDKYSELSELLFGSGADELVSKLTPEQERKKFERKQAQIGLASNIVGIGAGVAGLKDAIGNPNLKGKKGTTYRPKPIKISGKTKALAGGAVALQVANLGGDLVANRVLARSAKKEPVKKSEPGSSDIHIPGIGTLKRKAAKKGYEKAKPVAERTAGNMKAVALNGGAELEQYGTKVYTKGKAKVQKNDEVVWEGEFAKVDSDKRQVFGWASIVEVDGVPVVDLQGDYIDIDEVEKSAYDYVIKSRKGGDMHRRDGELPVHVSDMIESFIVTPEKREKMGLPESVPSGWWVGYQINDDEAWNLVKSGKRTGFSIHGRGQRTPDML